MSSIFYNRPAGGGRPKPYVGGAGTATRTTVGDADYTIKAWDRVVVLTEALTANRNWTLPIAASVQPGKTFLLMDVVGGLGVRAINIIASGSDTIPRGFPTMQGDYSQMLVTSDGVSSWAYDPVQVGVIPRNGEVVGNWIVDGNLQVLGSSDLGETTFTGNILTANLRDLTTTFYDNVDDTKQFRFQVSGVTTGTTRNLGVPDESGTLITTQKVQQSAAAAPMGYADGAGGTVTQGTSNVTAVTINKPCGRITMSTTVPAATSQQFTVNNSTVSDDDTVVLSLSNNPNVMFSMVAVNAASGSFAIRVNNHDSVSATAAAPVINFAVIKAVTT